MHVYLADSIRSLFTTVIALSFPPTFTLREREREELLIMHIYIVIINFLHIFLSPHVQYVCNAANESSCC